MLIVYWWWYHDDYNNGEIGDNDDGDNGYGYSSGGVGSNI
jgi:hypothetical protein